MFLFTDFIMDEDTKFTIGFSMVSFIAIFLLFNLILVLYFGANDLNLLYIKYSRQFMHWYHQYFPKPEEETESEDEEEKEAEESKE